MGIGRRIDDHIYKPPATHSQRGTIQLHQSKDRCKNKFYEKQSSYKTAHELICKYIKEVIDLPMFSNKEFIDKLYIEFDDNVMIDYYEKNHIYVVGFCTPSYDGTSIKLAFDRNYVAGLIENEDLNKTIDHVHRTVRHELFHAYQFYWLIKNGGTDAIENYRAYARKHPKDNDNILEIGAYAFEDYNRPRIQNVDKELAFLLKKNTSNGFLSHIGKLFGK